MRTYPGATEYLQDLATGRIDVALNDSLLIPYLAQKTRLPVKADRTKLVGKRQRILEGHVVVNGHELVVLASHWTSRLTDDDGTSRARYADQIYDAFGALHKKDRNADVLICGDFNDPPDAPSVTEHLRATGDAALVRKGGAVNFFGGCPSGTSITLDTTLIHYSNLTLLASFHHTPRTIRRALEFIEAGVVRAADFVDGECALADLPGLFKQMTTGNHAVKTLIRVQNPQ